MNTVCIYSNSWRRGTNGRTGLAKRILAVFFMMAVTMNAAQYGHFTYTDDGTSITITGYPYDGGGSVAIPPVISQKPVTRIGDYAFYGCGGLTSVFIPPSVTSIGNEAFSGCTGFKTINIPSGVTSIGGSVFAGCTSLSAISVAAENINYSSFQDGILFDKARTMLVACPAMRSQISLPGTVAVIGSGAFHSCGGLRTIYIPPTVTTIGSNAFKYCGALISVSIPSTVSVIGEGAFSNCAGLEKVDLPSRLGRIPNSAFNSCPKLQAVVIPSTVASIGNDAFANCSGLKSVTIPAKVASLGLSAFYNCSGLTQAIFLGAAPLKEKQNVPFGGAGQGFTVYYYTGKSGFTSPTWWGYPSVDMGEPTPQKTWLLKWGLPHDSAMLSDSNNDGVSLLMAYALNLNPTQNLSGSMPKAELTSSGLSMSFYSGAAGINYAVESSGDMINWTTEGIVFTNPEGNLIQTATVDATAPSRFLRLAVSQ